MITNEPLINPQQHNFYVKLNDKIILGILIKIAMILIIKEYELKLTNISAIYNAINV